ncbi:hypothetical protein CRP01_13510 [Flavilitoribacter nigricans DSM 23189 = NBRC 102662]|uniref:Uncharacterized protein n=1 Tax=Flavilitoribacter nigricans (strain ATCC 23147 / DSM 23189 / NBRC 102662 / NCIMB 1420 / SS-2) TaxID=1122177 RepID=A0A2D0NBW1_FLAN2|nr:hypothetical protein CRP01_13510 [Flavilitoribacter nigricans DSM 23189 = NBRC 102662]
MGSDPEYFLTGKMHNFAGSEKFCAHWVEFMEMSATKKSRTSRNGIFSGGAFQQKKYHFRLINW